MFSFNRSARRNSTQPIANQEQRETARELIDSIITSHPNSPLVIETADACYRIDTNGRFVQLTDTPFYATDDWNK